MAVYTPPKLNTAFIFSCSLVSQANTKLMQVNPTLATGDVKVSIDNGALANLATLPTVTPAAGSVVKVSLSASEMAGANITVVFIDASGSEWCDLTVNIQTSARQIDDLAFPVTSGRSMVVDAAGLVDSTVVKVGPTGAGTAQTAGDIPAKTVNLPASPAAVGSAMTLTSGERNSIADATLARTLGTESYAADGAVPTLAQVLFLIQQTIGDFSISGTTITVKQLDGAAIAATYTLDSAVIPTSRTRAT